VINLSLSDVIFVAIRVHALECSPGRRDLLHDMTFSIKLNSCSRQNVLTTIQGPFSDRVIIFFAIQGDNSITEECPRTWVQTPWSGAS
jgi:hypothetical protein